MRAQGPFLSRSAPSAGSGIPLPGVDDRKVTWNQVCASIIETRQEGFPYLTSKDARYEFRGQKLFGIAFLPCVRLPLVVGCPTARSIGIRLASAIVTARINCRQRRLARSSATALEVRMPGCLTGNCVPSRAGNVAARFGVRVSLRWLDCASRRSWHRAVCRPFAHGTCDDARALWRQPSLANVASIEANPCGIKESDSPQKTSPRRTAQILTDRLRVCNKKTPPKSESAGSCPVKDCGLVKSNLRWQRHQVKV